MKHSKNSKFKNFYCNPNVAWTVERYGIHLIRRDTGKKIMLYYPEAALWDFCSRKLPIQHIIKIMATIINMDLSGIQSWFVETIDNWIQAGWLTTGGDDG
jgi:hypothetical protein